MSSKLERYLTMANPFSTLLTRAIPALRKQAPGTEPDSRWRLSNDPDRNFAYWNALGVASWAVPLAIATTALVTAKAKRDVTRSEEKGGSGLLAASRPELSPRLAQNGKEKNSDIRLRKIDKDMISALSKQASSAGGLVSSALLGSIPIVALPASYWLANKLSSAYLSDKIERELDSEREALLALQNEEDLKRLALLGMVNPKYLNKKAALSLRDWAPWAADMRDGLSDAFKGIDIPGATKLLLWDSYLVPAIAASALLTIGGGAYLRKRNKDYKKIEVLRKKLLGENRLHDPAQLSIDIPEEALMFDDKSKQLQRIEGLPAPEDRLPTGLLENSKEKDALFA